MALFSGWGAYFTFWAVPAPQFWALKLCAGAVVGEGRGAPVYAPALSCVRAFSSVRRRGGSCVLHFPMSSLRESLLPFLCAGVVVHARADFLMFDFLVRAGFGVMEKLPLST